MMNLMAFFTPQGAFDRLILCHLIYLFSVWKSSALYFARNLILEALVLVSNFVPKVLKFLTFCLQIIASSSAKLISKPVIG